MDASISPQAWCPAPGSSQANASGTLTHPLQAYPDMTQGQQQPHHRCSPQTVPRQHLTPSGSPHTCAAPSVIRLADAQASPHESSGAPHPACRRPPHCSLRLQPPHSRPARLPLRRRAARHELAQVWRQVGQHACAAAVQREATALHKDLRRGQGERVVRPAWCALTPRVHAQLLGALLAVSLSS